MALPTYQNDLVLLATHIKRSDMVREALVTYAVNDNTVNLSAQQWADWAQAKFADAWKDQLDTSAAIVRTTSLKGDGTSTFTTGESTAAPTAGTNSMSSLPPNCAALLRKLTGTGGRRNRGRLYLPFMLNEGEVDEVGNISAGVQGDIQSDANDWKAALETGDSQMVIANRTYDAAWDVHPRHLVHTAIGPAVTALLVEPMIATQRKRLGR
jgi:hypothetical protein